jgi:hypothetical protein
MRLRQLLCAILVCATAACSSTRGGLPDATLDRELYQAQTKAERLLRYFEIQTLLVQFMAYAGGGIAARDQFAGAVAKSVGIR